ncbi:hypothetical protein RFI_37035, partial [Reticulomyxa filosa]
EEEEEEEKEEEEEEDDEEEDDEEEEEEEEKEKEEDHDNDNNNNDDINEKNSSDNNSNNGEVKECFFVGSMESEYESEYENEDNDNEESVEKDIDWSKVETGAEFSRICREGVDSLSNATVHVIFGKLVHFSAQHEMCIQSEQPASVNQSGDDDDDDDDNHNNNNNNNDRHASVEGWSLYALLEEDDKKQKSDLYSSYLSALSSWKQHA